MAAHALVLMSHVTARKGRVRINLLTTFRRRNGYVGRSPAAVMPVDEMIKGATAGDG